MKIKELRERQVLSVRELAEAAGVSKTTVTNIENGRAKAYPSTIRKLAKALSVEPYDLIAS